jgi:hypothetical protein
MKASIFDPPHLHLAAVAMAYTVRSGTLSYTEAASSLALAAIHDGALKRLSDDQFQELCGRLENSLVQAHIAIDFKSAKAIRDDIRRPIADRRSKEEILLIARVTNMLLGRRFPGQSVDRMMLPRLSERALYEVCRQEVRNAMQDRAVSNG